MKKTSLLLEQKTVEETIAVLDAQPWQPDWLLKFLELAETASLSYERGNSEERRQIVEILTSNRHVEGKNLHVEPSLPFREIANRSKNANGDPYRAIPRMWDNILASLTTLNTQGMLPKLSEVSKFWQDKDTVELNE